MFIYVWAMYCHACMWKSKYNCGSQLQYSAMCLMKGQIQVFSPGHEFFTHRATLPTPKGQNLNLKYR